MPDILLESGVKAVEETDKDVCCHRASILLATDRSRKWPSLDRMPPFGTIICSWAGEAGS